MKELYLFLKFDLLLLKVNHLFLLHFTYLLVIINFKYQ